MKKNIFFTIIGFIFVILIVVFFYFDQRNLISKEILSIGWIGVVIAVLMMTVLCMTPIPSEGLVVLYLKVYGVTTGIFIAWLGAIFASILIFVLAKHFGRTLLSKWITEERYDKVNNWVNHRGVSGFFIVRLLPIPAFVVNYIAGIIPTIRFWPYLWTGALSIIPYYVATALVYQGVAKVIYGWLVVGGVAIVAFWVIGLLFNRRKLFQ